MESWLWTSDNPMDGEKALLRLDRKSRFGRINTSINTFATQKRHMYAAGQFCVFSFNTVYITDGKRKGAPYGGLNVKWREVGPSVSHAVLI